MLLFVAVVFGSYGSCIAGHSAWQNSYLSRENPKRERILTDFLSKPSNYSERLGGKLTSYRVERNYSDLFATYTIFVCSGEIGKKQIQFHGQVIGRRVYTWKSN